MIASVPQADPPKLGWRIVRLFRPHRGALALIVAMILITSALSVVSALLVRRVFDDAPPLPPQLLACGWAICADASWRMGGSWRRRGRVRRLGRIGR